MSKTTVSQGSNGQYKVTIPRGIGDAMDLKDKKVEWTIKSGKTMEITIVDE